MHVAVSGFVCALFTCALVVAQVPKAAAPPAGGVVDKKFGKPAVRLEVMKARAEQQARLQVRAMAVAANREPLIQQFTTQGRPMVRAELIFVRNICKLDQEKFRQINRDSGEVLKDVASKMADGQLQPRVFVGGGQRGTANPDAGKLLLDGLVAVMKKDLAPEQWSRYRTELDKRLASRKQIGIRYLLDALDRDLYLSDQQRTKLTESLSSHWDDGWSIYLEYMLQGNQFYPMGIDPLVATVLSDTQRKVWQSFQRVGGFWGFGGMSGGFMNDQDALEEELGEVRKAEPANRAMQRGAFMKVMAIPDVGAMQPVEVRKVEMIKVERKKAETKK
ncbi:MAG: hypothetical protein ACHRXM_29025 [Isosphaerales bacterium]